METKEITLKSNPALRELSDYAGRTVDELRSRIITTLIQLGYLEDSPEYCGHYLEDILQVNQITLEKFAAYCFRVSYPRLLRMLKGIIVWGVPFECPECGCKVKIKNTSMICTNDSCDFSINLNPDTAFAFDGATTIYFN